MAYAKPTQARLIDQRARRRATQALIDLHREEYRDLYERHRREATAEAASLTIAAIKEHPSSTHEPTEPPRLMTGRRKPGQGATERIDVARCWRCVRHHDVGHVCASCGAAPAAAVEDVLRMRTNGLGVGQIAHRLDVPREAVLRILSAAAPEGVAR